MPRLNPGPAAKRGLRLLAEVGPMPLEPWALSMGWGERAAYYQARVLRQAGWLEHCNRPKGDGSLFYPSRAGAQIASARAIPIRQVPAAHAWPHLDGCAWTAAWLTVRGREMTGPRELLKGTTWRGELSWRERGRICQSGHRPDLLGRLPDGRLMPFEVELTPKSSARLTAIMTLYAEWLASAKAPAVMYVVADQELAGEVAAAGRPLGLDPDRGTLRIELLQTIQEQVYEMAASRPGGGAEVEVVS